MWVSVHPPRFSLRVKVYKRCIRKRAADSNPVKRILSRPEFKPEKSSIATGDKAGVLYLFTRGLFSLRPKCNKVAGGQAVGLWGCPIGRCHYPVQNMLQGRRMPGRLPSERLTFFVHVNVQGLKSAVCFCLLFVSPGLWKEAGCVRWEMLSRAARLAVLYFVLGAFASWGFSYWKGKENACAK